MRPETHHAARGEGRLTTCTHRHRLDGAPAHSYALHGGYLLGSSRTSGGFMSWGAPGRGRWITVYAAPDHVYMVVNGVRFDTSGRTGRQSRWQHDMRDPGGHVARHPPGL